MMQIRVKSHLTKQMMPVRILDEELIVKHDHDDHEFHVIQGSDGKLYLPLANQSDIGKMGRPGLYLIGSKMRPSFLSMGSRQKVSGAQIKRRGTLKEYHCVWIKSERGKPEIFEDPIYIGEVYDVEILP